MNYWLFKSEPQTYSFETLKKEKKTNWNGVRNFQARNFLRDCKKGDLILIYHSGKEKAVTGIARAITAGYEEKDSKKPGDWIQLDIAYEKSLKPVPLAVLKKTPALKKLLLIRQSRLSCMPVTPQEFKTIVSLSENTE